MKPTKPKLAPRTRAKRASAKRKRRSAPDLLQRIVKAAASEFKRGGFAGTATAAIARRADVTEAQLFRYFGSKSNLFRETIFKPLDEHFLAFISQRLRAHGGTLDGRQVSSLYTSELQHFISEHSQLLTSLVVAQTYDAGTAHGVGKINSLATYFEHGAAMMRQRIRGTPKFDPRLIVRIAFVAVLACIMFRDWIFPTELASDDEIEAAINAFVLAGVGANPGHLP